MRTFPLGADLLPVRPSQLPRTRVVAVNRSIHQIARIRHAQSPGSRRHGHECAILSHLHRGETVRLPPIPAVAQRRSDTEMRGTAIQPARAPVRESHGLVSGHRALRFEHARDLIREARGSGVIVIVPMRHDLPRRALDAEVSLRPDFRFSRHV